LKKERQGEKSKKQDDLRNATEILRECGADGWVAKYEQERAALS
jgi:hypothetical protein